MDPPAGGSAGGSPCSAASDDDLGVFLSDGESEAAAGTPAPRCPRWASPPRRRRHRWRPPRTEKSRKRAAAEGGCPECAARPVPNGAKRQRSGDAEPADGLPSPLTDGDRLFAQKCRELQGFIRPLAELLNGLRTGRYEKGLSTFQQSVAMDRIQRIIGVLQKPEMGERYLGTLLQVEMMLKLWFPHVAPKTAGTVAERRHRRGDAREATADAAGIASEPVCAPPPPRAAASTDPPAAATTTAATILFLPAPPPRAPHSPAP
ncbi:circadian-associated transcriptional repressor [Apteryx rowi]|uniref:circadian-associated transcriptional repressor n=1 Tax=Apteryx rowi TaxID=308060 RepID=UPI000E1D578B|nr:circadian-associated transcriptional repressor [Apteryx rowi]